MGIDQVSAEIGGLKASAKATREALAEHKNNAADRHKEISEKLDKVISLQGETNGRVTNNENAITNITKEGGKLDIAHKNGKDWRQTKVKALGAMFGFGFAGGAGGSTVFSWLKFWQ